MKTRLKLYQLFSIFIFMITGCVSNQINENKVIPNETFRSISGGDVIGYIHEDRSHAWLGIPYARAPIGDLRWRAPQEPIPWRGLLKAIEYGPACTQIGSSFGDPEAIEGSVHGSEDCLYLNVFAPKKMDQNEKLPVMLWIHGGSNTIGTSKLYDPSVLVSSERVIVVTINYRLGIFGWFAHPSISEMSENLEDGSGNYGTLDQIFALKWIKNNIDLFGGDANNITIFGESAGGHNVYSLLFSPLAEGLIDKAISQSGSTKTSSIQDAINYRKTNDEYNDTISSREIVNQLLVADKLANNRQKAILLQNSMQDSEIYSYLKNQSKEQILNTYYDNLDKKDYMHKVINDGYVMPLDGMNFKSKNLRDIPIITGTNRDEMKLFLAFDPEFASQRFSLTFIKDQDLYDISSEYGSAGWKVAAVDKPASELSSIGNNKVFGYRFDWDEEPKIFLMDLSRILGAAHAIEIPFILGGMELGGLEDFMFDEKNIDEAKKLSKTMMSYWAEFAYNGDPGKGRKGDLIRWETWNNLENENKFLIIDTPQDGGVRMNKEALSYEVLVERLLLDNRIPDDSMRCILLKKAAEADWMIDNNIMNSGLCNELN